MTECGKKLKLSKIELSSSSSIESISEESTPPSTPLQQRPPEKSIIGTGFYSPLDLSESLSGNGVYTLQKVGQGCWYTLHLLAALGEIEGVKSILRSFSLRFICRECRKHINEYLQKNPFEETDARLAFEYTVKFHNEVNKRLGRLMLTKSETEDLFWRLTKKEIETEECEGCDKEVKISKKYVM